jgi:hypothetical protein
VFLYSENIYSEGKNVTTDVFAPKDSGTAVQFIFLVVADIVRLLVALNVRLHHLTPKICHDVDAGQLMHSFSGNEAPSVSVFRGKKIFSTLKSHRFPNHTKK